MAIFPLPPTAIDDLLDEFSSFPELLGAITGSATFWLRKCRLLHQGATFDPASTDVVTLMLPRTFPVYLCGDMPQESDLQITDGDAASNITRWATSNCSNSASFSCSLHSILSHKFFSMWLSTVLANSAFFSAEISPFNPSDQTIYADCYVAMLVARRIGWDTLDACSCNPDDMWSEVKQWTSLYLEADRNLTTLDKYNFRNPNFRRFLKIPPLDKIFSGIRDKPNSLPGASLVAPTIPIAPSAPSPPPVAPSPTGSITPPFVAAPPLAQLPAAAAAAAPTLPTVLSPQPATLPVPVPTKYPLLPNLPSTLGRFHWSNPLRYPPYAKSNHYGTSCPS